MRELLIFLCALGSGVIAGFFFAFSFGVMKALGKLPPAQGVAAMQSINVVVINPVFLGVFLGTGIACLVVLVGTLMRERVPGGGRMLASLGAMALFILAYRARG